MKYSSSSDDVDYGLEIRNNQRAFTSASVKNSIYFSIRTYFFYFTYSHFKTIYIRLSILYYISLKY